jgi:hypothetical protein
MGRCLDCGPLVSASLSPQAMQYFNLIQEQSPKADAPTQLFLVEKIMGTLRGATNGGLIPGPDGNRQVQERPELWHLMWLYESEATEGIEVSCRKGRLCAGFCEVAIWTVGSS